MDENTEMRGTFACPICGQETPHSHPEDQVAAYHDDQVRRDGWTSTLVRRPRERGFYLARGHVFKVGPESTSSEKYMSWQRDYIAGRLPYVGGKFIETEVLFWDQGEFFLRFTVGDATPSGRETRNPVTVNPTHWRELPSFGVPNDADAVATQLGMLRAVVKDQRERLISLHTNNEYERERLVCELAEAKAGSAVPSGVASGSTTQPKGGV